MLTTVRRICGRIMHSQTALRSQLDKGWKNNSQFASPSIRHPTAWKTLHFREISAVASLPLLGLHTFGAAFFANDLKIKNSRALDKPPCGSEPPAGLPPTDILPEVITPVQFRHFPDLISIIFILIICPLRCHFSSLKSK